MQGTTITPILTMAVLIGTAACGAATHPPTVSDPPPTTTTAATPAIPSQDTPAPSRDAAPAPTAAPARRQAIEPLLESLWFGWYAAVAAGNPDALGETVALSRIHADGVEAIERSTLSFQSPPVADEYRLDVIEVLRDEEDCIVALVREDPGAFLEGGTVVERIGVFWHHGGRWYLATSWTPETPEFAWADDCELMVRDFA